MPEGMQMPEGMGMPSSTGPKIEEVD
jgi:hypothetical protein